MKPAVCESAAAEKPKAAAAAEKPKAAAAAEKPKADAVDYPTLQKAVFALAADNKEAVMGLIKRFEVESFKVLDPSRYAEALAAVQAKHAEIKAAATGMA